VTRRVSPTTPGLKRNPPNRRGLINTHSCPAHRRRVSNWIFRYDPGIYGKEGVRSRCPRCRAGVGATGPAVVAFRQATARVIRRYWPVVMGGSPPGAWSNISSASSRARTAAVIWCCVLLVGDSGRTRGAWTALPCVRTNRLPTGRPAGRWRRGIAQVVRLCGSDTIVVLGTMRRPATAGRAGRPPARGPPDVTVGFLDQSRSDHLTLLPGRGGQLSSNTLLKPDAMIR
jgi:hypothetical protein